MINLIFLKIMILVVLMIYTFSIFQVTRNKNLKYFILLLAIHLIKDVVYHFIPLAVFPAFGHIITVVFLALWIKSKIEENDINSVDRYPNFINQFLLFNGASLLIFVILSLFFFYFSRHTLTLKAFLNQNFLLNSYALSNIFFIFYIAARIKLRDIFIDIDEFENINRRKINVLLDIFLIFPILLSYFFDYEHFIILSVVSPLSYVFYAAIVFYSLRIAFMKRNHEINALSEQIDLLFRFMKETADLIRSSTEIDEILKRITESSLHNVNADGTAFLVFNKKEKVLSVKAVSGYHPPPYKTDDYVSIKRDYLQNLFKSASIDIQGSVYEHCLTASEAVFIKDTSADNNFEHNRIKGTKMISSIIMIPVIVFDELYGIFSAVKVNENSFFSNENYTHSEIFISNASLMIENFYSYRELLEKSEKLSESNKKIEEYNRNLQNMVEERTKQLLQSEKMASLGGLVAGVAHEINTPIGIGITATSHLKNITDKLIEKFHENSMKRNDLELYTEDNCESLDIIGSNLNKAAELIQSFKQIAVDRDTDKMKKFNLKTFFDDLKLSLRPEFKKTNYKLVVNCEKNIEIESIPGKLSQVIINLIMNSLRHAFKDTEDGIITISVALKDGLLEILFNDNGCGIPEENIEKIWDPFFTTARSEGGTGLGLNIVYNIVNHNLKGKITCESKIGEGTCFNITLPL